MSRRTLSLAIPSNMANAQENAIATHKLSNTLTLALPSTLQKNRFTVTVMRMASNEMTHPTVEMISKAFLWDFVSLKPKQEQGQKNQI